MITAIFDLDTTLSADFARMDQQAALHRALVEEQWIAEMWNGRHPALHLIELPGPTLAWEWWILDVVIAFLLGIFSILLVYPLVYIVWSNLSDRALPVSLSMRAPLTEEEESSAWDRYLLSLQTIG